MQDGTWLSYSDLAWTEPVIASTTDYSEETGYYVDLIKQHARNDPKSLLHLGCGAGGNDHTFKKHFKVTGVDISDEMLTVARTANPDVAYVRGDMRSVRLDGLFDVVAVPDSIDYMATLVDLRKTIATACKHLTPGGVLMIVAKTREEFRDNNFCYTGAKDDVEITIFENNYGPRNDPSIYEATLVYLIRQNGKLSVHTDVQRLGLFSQAEWTALFEDAGLIVHQARSDGVYDQYILGQGQYPMTVFLGIKPSRCP